jgi:hypothetical protein
MYIKIGLGILALMLCPKGKIKTPIKVKNNGKNSVNKQAIVLPDFSSDLKGFKDFKSGGLNPDLIKNDYQIIEQSNELFQRKNDRNKAIFLAKQKSKKPFVPKKTIYKNTFDNSEVKFSKDFTNQIK